MAIRRGLATDAAPTLPPARRCGSDHELLAELVGEISDARANTSVGPPAGNATTMVTWRLGSFERRSSSVAIAARGRKWRPSWRVAAHMAPSPRRPCARSRPTAISTDSAGAPRRWQSTGAGPPPMNSRGCRALQSTQVGMELVDDRRGTWPAPPASTRRGVVARRSREQRHAGNARPLSWSRRSCAPGRCARAAGGGTARSSARYAAGEIVERRLHAGRARC
jgi:hypothetical protein